MPTVHREAGFVFRIRTDDHDPPHVHVEKDRGEAKIALGNDETAPYSLDAGRMPTTDVRHAIRITQAYQTRFLETWRKFHG